MPRKPKPRSRPKRKPAHRPRSNPTTRRRRTPAEADFQAEVMKLAKQRGWKVFHDWDPVMNEPGFPDLVMARDGIVIFAELKRAPGIKPRKAQREWLSALAHPDPDATHLVFLWSPVHWDEIREVLA